MFWFFLGGGCGGGGGGGGGSVMAVHTSSLEGCEWLNSCPGLHSRERIPDTR